MLVLWWWAPLALLGITVRDRPLGQSVVKMGCDCSGGAAIQEWTLQSRTCFNGALVLTESTPWMCPSWRWEGCNPAWSAAVYWVHWLWGLPGGARSATAYGLPRSTQHKLQSSLQMAATYVGLGGAQVSTKRKPRPAATSARLEPLSESYGACWGHMQLVWEILGKSEAQIKTSPPYGKFLIETINNSPKIPITDRQSRKWHIVKGSTCFLLHFPHHTSPDIPIIKKKYNMPEHENKSDTKI